MAERDTGDGRFLPRPVYRVWGLRLHPPMGVFLPPNESELVAERGGGAATAGPLAASSYGVADDALLQAKDFDQ
jgi:hypothetical protein